MIFGVESNWNFDADAVDAVDTADDPDETDDDEDNDGDAIDDVADSLRTQVTCGLELLSCSSEMRCICSSRELQREKRSDQFEMEKINNWTTIAHIT